jgi:hypothetical protein
MKTIDIPFQDRFSSIFNSGTLNTADGNDIITGTISRIEDSPNYYSYYGIYNIGSIYTGDGNDKIKGSGVYGLVNYSTITTDNGNDIISGIGEGGAAGLYTRGTINSGEGNDIIIGTNTSGPGYGIFNGFGTPPDEVASSTIDTGDGNDVIIGRASAGILNIGIINTGNGADYIICDASFNSDPGSGFYNSNIINTGDGNDIITSNDGIYNEGIINTGNDDDSIIVDRGSDGTGTGYGIYNNGGAIITGNGNDSIIANEGFKSAPNSSGAWFLGEGEDYIKGFGSGDFYGGNGNDTLELTPGTYTVGIWGEGGESPIFTKGDQLMITSEFEKLKAGSTIYDFTSLTAGQIIIVA